MIVKIQNYVFNVSTRKSQQARITKLSKLVKLAKERNQTYIENPDRGKSSHKTKSNQIDPSYLQLCSSNQKAHDKNLQLIKC